MIIQFENKVEFQILYYFSFTSEEIAWIEDQKYQYNQVRLNLQPSFFRDFFLAYIGVIEYTRPTINTVKCIMKKMRTFLEGSREFQSLNPDQRQLILTRNVPLAISFVAITAESISDVEEGFLFFKNLLTSSTSLDLFVKYLKPEKTTLKTLHQKYKIIFNSEEEENYDKIMKNLHQYDFLTTFDMEIFTISLLFHTDSNDYLPSFQSYRNMLLKSLEIKMQSGFDTHSLHYEFVKNAITWSKFPMISNALNNA